MKKTFKTIEQIEEERRLFFMEIEKEAPIIANDKTMNQIEKLAKKGSKLEKMVTYYFDNLEPHIFINGIEEDWDFNEKTYRECNQDWYEPFKNLEDAMKAMEDFHINDAFLCKSVNIINDAFKHTNIFSEETEIKLITYTYLNGDGVIYSHSIWINYGKGLSFDEVYWELECPINQEEAIKYAKIDMGDGIQSMIEQMEEDGIDTSVYWGFLQNNNIEEDFDEYNIGAREELFEELHISSVMHWAYGQIENIENEEE